MSFQTSHIYFIIDLLKVEIFCQWAEKEINARISQPPFLRFPSYHRHFQTLWANSGLVPNSRSGKCLSRPHLLCHNWAIRSRNLLQMSRKGNKCQNLTIAIAKIACIAPSKQYPLFNYLHLKERKLRKKRNERKTKRNEKTEKKKSERVQAKNWPKVRVCLPSKSISFVQLPSLWKKWKMWKKVRNLKKTIKKYKKKVKRRNTVFYINILLLNLN